MTKSHKPTSTVSNPPESSLVEVTNQNQPDVTEDQTPINTQNIMQK